MPIDFAIFRATCEIYGFQAKCSFIQIPRNLVHGIANLLIFIELINTFKLSRLGMGLFLAQKLYNSFY